MALAPTPQPYRFTVEEYLAFERASDERHEYLDGVIYAMPGSASPQAMAGEGGPLNWPPSAHAVAGNGAPLNWRPSADAVAGDVILSSATSPHRHRRSYRSQSRF